MLLRSSSMYSAFATKKRCSSSNYFIVMSSKNLLEPPAIRVLDTEHYFKSPFLTEV